MPTLAQSLEGQDFGHFQIVAETWGIELDAQDTRQANKTLSASIPELLFSQWGELAPDVQNALTEISHHGGKLRWAQFVRKYGELRDIGAGRRDKDLPHRNPISIAEKLWYRALIGRAFLDSPDGPQEFAFIPDDLLAKLPSTTNSATEILGRLARPEERAYEIPATDRILDEACTLLAGLRGGLNESELKAADDWRMPIETIKALLSAAKIIDKEGRPIPEETRRHLESSRGDALALLARTWLQSQELNDLHLMPSLAAEGNWENDPVHARDKLIEYIRSVPAGQWWSIASLVADIKAKYPDYLRAEYESWYLRDSNSGEYLRGFEHWDSVDGALIVYLIRGPLHWLGILDLAAPTEGQPAAAFRWSRFADTVLNEQTTLILRAENSRLKVDSRGTVFVPPFVPRALRYVLSRFCDWLPKQKDAYRYQVSARALERARKQSLEVRQLAGLLKAHNSSALPPNLVQALKRWEQQGTQARIESMQVLRLNSAAALKALRTSKAARYLGEPLGPTSVVIKAGAGQQVLQALVELGHLGSLDEEIK
jgi:hypothetical protein